MAAMNKELEDLINCPICFNLASEGPIWTCKNGHHVCNTCKPKLDNCGSCRQPITTRSLGLERMRDLIPMTCQFGCGIKMKSGDIKNHEETCHNGPLLTCASLNCHEKFRLKNLISHIKTCHSEIQNYDGDCLLSKLHGMHVATTEYLVIIAIFVFSKKYIVL
jgi:E3 ubiquitin-protein ligase SIAH1